MAHAQVAPTSRTTGARPAFPAPEARPAAPPSFTAVLRQRHCARLLVASVAGRLPLGMVPAALILAARSDGHSLATASMLAALYGVAPAIGLPLLGRLADVRGLPLPCHLGAALVAAALGALALGGTSHLLCAVLAGAGCPPLEEGLRSLWPAVLPDAAHVRTPTRWIPPPRRSSTSQAPPSPSPWPPGSPPGCGPCPGGGRRLGGLRRLRHRASRPGLACGDPPPRPAGRAAPVFLGGTVGALDVASIAVAGRQDAAWLAGALPAVFSAAGLLGGILFTRLQPAAAPQPRHLLLMAALFAAGWLPLLAPLPAPAVLAATVLPGALFVPLLTVASLTLTALAPAGTSTEAVGWMSSAMRLGLAGGTALAGPLGGHFALPLLAAALCALLLTAPIPSAAAPAAA
ncbi:MFS transporter [Streptomyces sp. NPDC001621]|uniref:MFS transporter n=1 Tax=Streptomyces sp. NPDC001621 TaxID=3364594 RepID=UPI00369CACFA